MKTHKHIQRNTTVGGMIALAMLALAFAPVLLVLIPFIVIGITKHRHVRDKE